MNRIIAYSLLLCVTALFSCKKDETKTVFDSNARSSFTAPVLLTPAADSNIVITASNVGTSQLVVKWKRANYGTYLGITYTLTADSAGVKTVTLGSTNADSMVINYSSLNTKLLTKLAANVKIPLSLTLTSWLTNNQNDTLASESVKVNITAYFKPTKVVKSPSYIYIAGDFEGWSITYPNPAIIVSDTSDGIYEGYIYISNGGSYKMYTAYDWNQTSYGDGGSGALIVANCACSNFYPPSNGYFEIGVNTNTMTWSQTLTTWSIIGDATPGGWSTDTQMAYDATNKVWTVTAYMKAAGSFKFRANDDWIIDFGLDSNGKLAYADNPILGYVNRNNITVPADGTYVITLDLSNALNYNYSAVLQ